MISRKKIGEPLFDYSRDARRKRKAQNDPDQTMITDFFSVIDEIDRLTTEAT